MQPLTRDTQSIAFAMQRTLFFLCFWLGLTFARPAEETATHSTLTYTASTTATVPTTVTGSTVVYVYTTAYSGSTVTTDTTVGGPTVTSTATLTSTSYVHPSAATTVTIPVCPHHICYVCAMRLTHML